ncbi:MAG: hydrogenase nickel incorporation protein HypB [Acidobacteriota bacterium]|nr:hydrogenase nickel incorporation protein HypB [Acidobacteriota bacterium]
MCETCGCGDPEVVPVDVQESLLAANDRTARHNREHFAAERLLAINLMGSPGSGKTALLEATASRLEGRLRLAALSGDLATDRDARRLGKAGIPSLSITTGSGCHLDADLVHQALHDLPWRQSDLLFIENVGNLVCPAVYDLGQTASVVALAVTEGEDKPLKYPTMFRKADLVLLTKVDLLPHLPGVDVAAIEDALARTMPEPRMIAMSAASGEGVDEWIQWLEERRAEVAAAGRLAARHEHGHGHGHGHGHEHGDGHRHGHAEAGSARPGGRP